MDRDPRDDSDREQRRNEVLLGYVEAIESGQKPDTLQLLEAHPDLRGELEAFLADYDQVARITAPLRATGPGEGVAASPPPPRDEPRPRPPGMGEIGDFRLLSEVGRGGMGVVYEAEQISLRRRVALKILPFAAAIDPRRLQRFKTEALTAAHVQHERIVPVYAVGCERGVHYYAMQFIDGQSLAALIADLRRLGPGSGPCPDLDGTVTRRSADPADPEGSRPEGEIAPVASRISEERTSGRRRYFDRAAGLAQQAALALEHAHQAGVVHRDVKPGNLLLDLRGQLWVTDFGLAQVTGDPGLTLSGELLGTLRYSSPEQVRARRGVVDHRSDIYSLGATLYELLTLRPLFEGLDRNSLIEQIAEDDPTPPRSLDRDIPPELETITLKALRKDPADRYATAQELADDLQRFLDGRPILARPPTSTERIRHLLRRHPSIVGASVVGLVLLTAASLVSTALVRREQAKTLAQQKETESAYRRERQRAEEADARFRLARRAVDELIRVSEEELAHRPGMEGLRKRLLVSALAYYREFLEQLPSDPGAQAELRDATRKVGTILADLAVLRAAGQIYLLAQPAALDDLRLDPDQRARVAALSDRAGRRWMESFGDPAEMRTPAERLRAALELARVNESEVAAILSPSQHGRLRQIALQADGPTAFREPEVVDALGLTPQQSNQIRLIVEETYLTQMRQMRSGKPVEEVGRRAVERIVRVLSADQARRWEEMTGPPIRGTLNGLPTLFRS